MTEIISFPISEPVIVLIGPTAIGKTALSIELAQRFNFEIISVDSMQVYRYMDIGTAKITNQEKKNIPHHLIDVVDPDKSFDAGKYEKMALSAIVEIFKRGNKVLLTGGTGLYLDALINGLAANIPAFPEIRKEIKEQLKDVGHNVLHEQLMVTDRVSAKRIHKNDTHRLVRALEINKGTGRKWSDLIEEHKKQKIVRFPNLFIIGLTSPREKLYKRIDRRSRVMLTNGLQREVEGLLQKGYGPELSPMKSIGYNHMVKMLNGDWTREEMVYTLARDTRRYAKRQYTWFKKIKGISWFDIDRANEVPGAIDDFFFNNTIG